MTKYNRLFKLAKNTAQAIRNEERLEQLEQTDLLSANAKRQIMKNLSDSAIETNLRKLDEIDVEADWEKIKPKLKGWRNRSIPRFYPIAAGAILLISLVFLTYHFTQRNKVVSPDQTPIVAGSDKAILTTENGKEIILKKGISVAHANISYDGTQLEYRNDLNMVEIAYNTLTIPRGGRYQLSLADGTKVWINADTKLKYPVSFISGNPREVELLYGEAYFVVSPSHDHNGDRFKVLTQNQKIEVVGTEFNVNAYGETDYIITTLVEGQIDLKVSDQIVRLSPNERSTVNSITSEITKSPVDVKNDVAWIKGYFSFKDKTLEEIMMVMARWYDVDISVAPELKNKKFSGLLSRSQNLQDILEGITDTKTINSYEVKGHTVNIR